jgi:predicted outer membrane protein
MMEEEFKAILARIAKADYFTPEEFYQLVATTVGNRQQRAEEELAKIERRGFDRGYWAGQAAALREVVQLLGFYRLAVDDNRPATKPPKREATHA